MGDMEKGWSDEFLKKQTGPKPLRAPELLKKDFLSRQRIGCLSRS